MNEWMNSWLCRVHSWMSIAIFKLNYIYIYYYYFFFFFLMIIFNKLNNILQKKSSIITIKNKQLYAY